MRGKFLITFIVLLVLRMCASSSRVKKMYTEDLLLE